MSRLRRMIPRGLKRQLRRMQHRAQIRAITRAHAKTAPQAPDLLLPTALVIPVHNDAVRLARLLAVARDMGFAQIVVVDDGSEPPVQAENVTLIRHDAPRGPGPARNAGIDAVTTPYLAFIDSDDLPTAALPALLADLAEDADFDICLFKHADSRFSNADHWGQPDWDEALWQAANRAIGTLAEAPCAVWPLLAQTANYPWNKVYRTAFLRDHGIRFAGTPVHEDITPHWLCFVHADRIMTSDRACVWHMIAAEEGRQTNRRGAERLAVFDALAPVVAATHQPDMRAALVTFVLGLADWIRGTLDDTHRLAFEDALHHWLTVTVAGWHADIAATDPALAARMTARP
ncbi:MAG: glycosyltransferase [Alphaproteobacteria bacterium]|nr:glycosyltransferase [Alphaproteobacteria bacterium]